MKVHGTWYWTKREKILFYMRLKKRNSTTLHQIHFKFIFHRPNFYGTQYHPIPLVEKNLYVIQKDLYVRIRRLRLIMYHRFFSVVWVVFISGMGSTWVLSKIYKIILL
jgi:hypothetical protein